MPLSSVVVEVSSTSISSLVVLPSTSLPPLHTVLLLLPLPLPLPQEPVAQATDPDPPPLLLLPLSFPPLVVSSTTLVLLMLPETVVKAVL